MTALDVPPPRRHYWPDEEPETGYVDHSVWVEVANRTCGFCGLEGHRVEACPHRPLY